MKTMISLETAEQFKYIPCRNDLLVILK